MAKALAHVALHYVLPEGERDLWDAQDQETKNSWTPVDGFQAPEGEPTEYLALLDESQIEAFNEARNCKYAVEAQIAYKQGWLVEEIVGTMADNPVPSAETFRYMNSALPDSAEGVTYFLLDTGANLEVCKSLLGTSKIVGTKNFVNGGTNVQDVDGHGTMCFSLLVPRDGAEVWIFKVLGDDGTGSSGGIDMAIREAAKIARANPRRKYILSGSLGGAPGRKFQPYADACAIAEAAGVLCRWSAGNDGVRGVGAPGNWKEQRASIAFNRRDLRASFSNHETWCGYSSEGEGILVVTKNGSLAKANGTSFSLPVSQRECGKIASQAGVSVFEADAAIRAMARKTNEPFEEESAGLIDVAAAMSKLTQGSPQPAPAPDPTPPAPAPLRKVAFSVVDELPSPIPEPIEVTLKRGGVTKTHGFMYPTRR